MAEDTVSDQTVATVTQASPLRVVVDGATVDSPAKAITFNGFAPAYSVGDRVVITIRNPREPLVTGRES